MRTESRRGSLDPGTDCLAKLCGAGAEGCRGEGESLGREKEDRRRMADSDVQGPARGGGTEALSSSRRKSSGGWGSGHFGRGGAEHTQQDRHPRGFLRAGSCITAKATEPCLRSQEYLWRHGWAEVRQGWALRIPGEEGGPQPGKGLPRTHSVLAGTRRLSSGVRLRGCPPMVTTEEPSWGRRAGGSDGGYPASTAVRGS